MKRMKDFRALVTLLTVAVVGSACSDAAASTQEMTVYATPTCGCCGAWIEHMRANGFAVQVVYQNDLTAIRSQYDVPIEVTSCHMGVVDGFAVEGHVPADVVRRLLAERPPTLGLAVPGMPVGAPGMEHPDGLVQPYEVYTFDADGPTGVFEFRN